jgi:hypothetical protein
VLGGRPQNIIHRRVVIRFKLNGLFILFSGKGSIAGKHLRELGTGPGNGGDKLLSGREIIITLHAWIPPSIGTKLLTNNHVVKEAGHGIGPPIEIDIFGAPRTPHPLLYIPGAGLLGINTTLMRPLSCVEVAIIHL